MFVAKTSSEMTRPPAQGSTGVALIFLLWFLLAMVVAYLSSARADPLPQGYFSIGLLVALFFFKRFNPERRTSRIFFLSLATFIVLRYLFWRVLYTIEFTDWLRPKGWKQPNKRSCSKNGAAGTLRVSILPDRLPPKRLLSSSAAVGVSCPVCEAFTEAQQK
jgi:hypothetical protein